MSCEAAVFGFSSTKLKASLSNAATREFDLLMASQLAQRALHHHVWRRDCRQQSLRDNDMADVDS
jgi:hypothetical protein